MDYEKNKPKNLLEVKGITKSFYGTIVLDNINFSLPYGEVLGLVGRNGAGKSTLVKILTGAYHPDGGEIFIDGKHVQITDVNEAHNLGIAQVFQELSLADNLTVAENIFVGCAPNNKIGLIDRKKLNNEAEKLLSQFSSIKIRPTDIVKKLSVCQRQIVEILKALSKSPKLLILDEPTSALEESEIEILYGFIGELKQKGYSIIFISHHMSEIFKIVDRVMVLLDGENVGMFTIDEISMEGLVNLIVNEEFKTFVSNKKLAIEKVPLLEVENLNYEPYFRNISFSIHKGEILGIAGLAGSGKSELCQSLFGVYGKIDGVVKLNGEIIKLANPSKMKSKGIFLLPQNRKTEGLFLNDQIKNNMISTVLPKMTDFGFLHQKKIRQAAEKFINLLKIKMDSLKQFVRFLSGGNQQKVLVAKSVAPNPKLLIALDPTRGIDVGSKADIDRLLFQLSEEGMSILTISSELEELTNTCDRILVMNEGMINAEFVRSEFNNRDILFAVHQ